MKKFDVHVCLVSDQALPNFIPVLAEDFRPQEVILLATEPMKKKAETLAEVMKNRCCVKVQIFDLHDEYDIQSVREEIFNLLLKNIDKRKVALNVTGGTKLMAIGAYGMFRDEVYPVFYFTAKDNRILLLENNEQFVLQPSKIKIEDYLQLYGYPVRKGYKINRQTQRNLPKLWEELVKGINNFAECLTALNYVISHSNDLTTDMPKVENQHQQNFNYLLHLLEDNELLSQQNGKLHFPDLETKKYVAGGWFEDYVFNVISKIPGVQDVALNVQIENSDLNSHQNNELDVVVLANNVLHVLECKTANFAKNKKEAENALYKLETLKKLGGLKTRAALISYRETGEPGGINPIRDRAKGAQIELIERKDLPGLQKLLTKWITDENRIEKPGF